MKKENNNGRNILYLYLILFFGWILTQFILINQNSLIINEDEITGLALIDPLGGLGDFLSSDVSVSGGSYPFGLVLAALMMIFSALFVGARNSFFKDDERKGAAVVFSLGATAIVSFATNLLGTLINFISYLGFFTVIAVVLLLFLDGYFVVHKRVREGYKDITNLAAEGQSARNALLEARYNQAQPPQGRQQPQTQQQGSSWYKPWTWGRGGQQPVQPQQQRRQTQRQAQQNLRQQQQIRQRWLLFLQQSQQNLNLLVNQLNNQRNWNNVLGQLARISQIRRDLPNIRTGNIGTLLRTGQTHMQRVLANPNDVRNINLATQFLNNVQTTYNLILNQL